MPTPRDNPQLFGHEAAEAMFERVRASGRLPHAWLLHGPPGIGKATLAYRLARRVVAGAEAPTACPDDPQSALFRRVAHGSEPDLFVLERVINPKTRKLRTEIIVDQVRAVTAGLHETTVGRGGRAVVVDVADELNVEAANAFLKLLEEPPAGVVLLLACHAPGRIPRTLVSRCVRLALAPLAPEAMSRALAAAGIAAADSLSAPLLALARGAPGRYAQLGAAGYLDHYATLLADLAAGRADRRRLLDATDRLAGLADAALAVDLLGTVLRRAALQASHGRLAPELVPDEAGQLAALTRGRRLDRWMALWEKLRHLPDELDHLNLDARQSLFLALAALAGEADDRRAG